MSANPSTLATESPTLTALAAAYPDNAFIRACFAGPRAPEAATTISLTKEFSHDLSGKEEFFSWNLVADTWFAQQAALYSTAVITAIHVTVPPMGGCNVDLNVALGPAGHYLTLNGHFATDSKNNTTWERGTGTYDSLLRNEARLAIMWRSNITVQTDSTFSLPLLPDRPLSMSLHPAGPGLQEPAIAFAVRAAHGTSGVPTGTFRIAVRLTVAVSGLGWRHNL